MRLLIVGSLDGHITTAGKIAHERGAKVAHVQAIPAAMSALRSGQGADLVMIDVKLDIANLVSGLSHRPAVVGVFDKSDETAKRQAAFEQCEGLNAFLGAGNGSRKADIVAIIDSAGKVVARDLNVNAMYGEDLRSKFPSVAMALRGEATKDIWTLQNRMTRVAVAPIIHPDGTTRGALLVGYVLIHLRMVRFEQYLKEMAGIRTLNQRLETLAEALSRVRLDRVEQLLQQLHEDVRAVQRATSAVEETLVRQPPPIQNKPRQP